MIKKDNLLNSDQSIGIFREISVTNINVDSSESRREFPYFRRRDWLYRRVVSLTHVAIYACIIINGTRVGVVRTHVSEPERGVYLRDARAKMCNCVTHRIQLYGHGESDA